LATVIRLTRKGRTHTPFFHIGVFDSRTRRDGTPIETLGWFDPNRKDEPCKVELERVRHWIGLGAKPSETVGHLLNGFGIETESWKKDKKLRKDHQAGLERLKKKRPPTGEKKARPAAEAGAKGKAKRRKLRTANSKTRKAKKKGPGAAAS